MLNKLKSNKMKILLLYVFFGILTTVVNILLFWLLVDMFRIQYLISNFFAIIVSILFAYITNKWYVFKSETETRKELICEVIIFISARIGTLIFDMIGMFVLISFLNLNSLFSKIFVNVVVVVLNYIFSKLFVFKRDE